MAKFGRVVLGGCNWPDRRVIVEARGVLRNGRLVSKRYRNPVSGEFQGAQFYIDKLLMRGGDTFRLGTTRAKWVS